MRDDSVAADNVQVGPEAPEPPATAPGQPHPAAPRPRKPYIKLAFGLLLLLFAWLAITAPLSKSLQPIAPPGITLLSAQGQPIARNGATIEGPVRVSALPAYVPNAFVAIEDRRFYIHIGVDPWGMARAAWHNARSGGVREGGSTITQQLAKLSFLTLDRTAKRKVQEVLIAFWLEIWLSKEDILSRYLSNVYFGDNVYGLRAAAHHYFSTDPEHLTVSQAAMLAGLIQAPSRLAPTANLKGAQRREKLVVAAMADAGLLDPARAARVRPATLHVSRERSLPTGTYFADWVLPEARALPQAPYGERVVKTTLDANLQRIALRTIRRAALGGAQVALVAMRPDGSVVAMVGGKDYAASPFNRATQARRQPGSTFKLFVYLAALRAGMAPDSMVSDTPLTIGNWSPKNHGGRYRGSITLREAFAISSNVAAVRIAQKIGLTNVERAARDLGVSSPLANDPTLPLGTSGLTLLELTSAYAAVAADSYPVTPRGLPQVRQSWFQRFWNNRRSFGSSTREELLDLLAAAANEGTGRGAALRTATFGKTGTSQDSRDAVFVGFSGDLVTGVWVGNDDNKPLPGMAGGGLPARIWRDFMSAALKTAPAGTPAIAPPPPPVVPDDDGFEINVPLGDDQGDPSFTVRVSRPDERPDDEAEGPIAPQEGPPPNEDDTGDNR